MDSDVIVVGAGPAGCSAAYRLVHAGLRVRLFEQMELPRYKPCGGCLSLKVDQLLEPDFHSVVERTVKGATFTTWGREGLHVRSDRPVAYMVMRDRFDHFLAEKARKAGAELHTAERVVDTEETPDGVRVKTPRGDYLARFLIGADGANGVVARRPEFKTRRRLAICLEGEISVIPDDSVTVLDEVRIEFGAVPFGYGWVFPKGDHLSVGVGGLKEKIGNPRSFYDDFLVDQDLADRILEEKRRGYAIPVFGGRRTLAKGRTLLVGDAASLIDPFLGEGIYYAILSGQVAADTVAEGLSTGEAHGVPSRYTRRIEEALYPDFRAAQKCASFLFAFPRAGFEILERRPEFVELYFDVIRGEASYRDLWRTMRSRAAMDVVRSLWPSRGDTLSISEHYDRIAPHYDSALRLWRALVAAAAQDALGDLLGRYVPPGGAVLDAGTGTGETVRLLLERAAPGRVVGLDVSRGMLRAARKKIRDPCVTWEHGHLTALPYPDDSFDVVTCTWTLEVVADPLAAVQELLRVVKDDGVVIYCFSSRPDSGLAKLYGRLVEEWSEGTLRGRFLQVEERPYHDCSRSSLATYAGGLATVVVLGKCCRVEDPRAPCLPLGVGPGERGRAGPVPEE